MTAAEIQTALAADPMAVFETPYPFVVRGLSGGVRGSWNYAEQAARFGPKAGEWVRAGPSPSWHWATIHSRYLLRVVMIEHSNPSHASKKACL